MRPASLLADGPSQLHGHRRAAQAAEGIAAAGQPRVYDGRRFGQLRARLVVVGDDQLQAQLPGHIRLVHAADAAVDRNEQFGLLRGQRADGVAVQSIAFVNAMGNVIAHVGAWSSFRHSQRIAVPRYAVHVVVAVDGDSPAGTDGGINPLGGRTAARQQFRVAQAGKLGVEKIAGGRRVGHAAADEQFGHHRRDARGVLQGRDAGRIVRMDAPTLGHGVISHQFSVISFHARSQKLTTEN